MNEIVDVIEENLPVSAANKNEILKINSGVFELPDPAEVARRAEQSKKMLVATYKVLSYSNITLFGDSVYVDADGSKKIANLFGLIIRQNEAGGRIDYQKEIIDEKTNHYVIHITGRVWHHLSPENYEVYEGTADSFDDWYRQYQIVEEREIDGKTKKVVVSAQTLPIALVQKKATANLLQICVKKKLGLKFNIEELQNAGFEISKIKGFNYNSGKGADTQELADKKKIIWEQIVDLCHGNVELAKKTLQTHTKYGDFTGHTDINKVSEKQLGFLSSKIEKALKEQAKAMGEENNAD